MNLDVTHMIGALIEIVWLSLLLSGDNAVLLAFATRALPQDKRRIAVNLGTVLFILLRAALGYALFVSAGLPGFGLIGAVLLLWFALSLAMRSEADGQPDLAPSRTLLASMLAVLAADAPAALSNMLALQAAAQGGKNLILFGFALSIPMLALGSAQFVSILRRTPLLWASAGLLGWLAGQMAAADSLVLSSPMPIELMRDFAPPVGAMAAILLAYGYLRGRHIKPVPEE
jgi:YjbE family integral membrane protein